MAKSTKASKSTVAEATPANAPVQEQAVPSTEATPESAPTTAPEQTEEQAVKQYYLDVNLNFTDKQTKEIKFTTNVKYSMPVIKISDKGTKRQEMKIFIDGIFFGRTSKYFQNKMYLKTKSGKEFTFEDGIELKKFVYERASEFGSQKKDLAEETYKAIIQTYGLTEEDVISGVTRNAVTPQAETAQQILFV